MAHAKKQMKKKGATQLPEESDDIHQEIQELEQKVLQKQNELFQLQRNKHRGQQEAFKTVPPKNIFKNISNPEDIILSNSVESLKREIELLSLLSGVEVQSYWANDHCTIVYHMQHDSHHHVKHGLKIDTSSGKNEVSSSSLPLGFNLRAVLEQYDNVMHAPCLLAVRKALVAYYDRLQQFDNLKKMVQMEAQLFKTLDGSHVEASFAAADADEAAAAAPFTLALDYGVHDTRPERWAFRNTDLPDDALEALMKQCAVFKRKPLDKAFKEVFIDGVWPYVMVQQMPAEPDQRRRKRKARPHNIYNGDETLYPNDCSSEDDAEPDQRRRKRKARPHNIYNGDETLYPDDCSSEDDAEPDQQRRKRKARPHNIYNGDETLYPNDCSSEDDAEPDQRRRKRKARPHNIYNGDETLYPDDCSSEDDAEPDQRRRKRKARPHNIYNGDETLYPNDCSSEDDAEPDQRRRKRKARPHNIYNGDETLYPDDCSSEDDAEE